MKRLEQTSTPRRRKGLRLTDRELDEVFGGGRYELEADRDYVGSTSTAANQLRELWRERRGQLRITEDSKNGVITVEVEAPTVP